MKAGLGGVDPDRPPSQPRLEANGISLNSQSGVEIHFGEGERAAKFARLRPIRSELSRRGLLAQSIRLDNRARPGWVGGRPSRGTNAEGDSQVIGYQESRIFGASPHEAELGRAYSWTRIWHD